MRPLLRADLGTSWRVINSRLEKHPFITVLLSLIGLLVAVVFTISVLLVADQGDIGLSLERWHMVLLVFSFFLARAVTYTYRKFLKAKELKTIFTTPLSVMEVTISKFMVNLLHMLSLFFIGLVGLHISLFFGMLADIEQRVLPLPLVAEGLGLIIVATCIGFTLPIKLQLFPVRRAAKALAPEFIVLLCLFLTSFSVSQTSVLPPSTYLGTLMALVPASLIIVFHSKNYSLYAWNAQVHKSSFKELDRDRRSVIDVLGRFLGKQKAAIMKKDLRVLLRERDAVGTLIAAIGLNILMLFVFYFIPLESETEFQDLIYPFYTATGLFLCALLAGSLLALSTVGFEGKRLWILKTMPIDAHSILAAKGSAVLYLALPLTVSIVIPIPLLAKFPAEIVVFFIIEAVAFAIAFTGIGIWGAATFPNFDETMRGMPDLITQFGMIIICFVVGIFIGGIPAGMVAIQHDFGVVAAFISLMISFAIYLGCIMAAAKRFENIDITMFKGMRA